MSKATIRLQGGWAGFLDQDGSDEEEEEEDSDGFQPEDSDDEAAGSDAGDSGSESESLIDEDDDDVRPAAPLLWSYRWWSLLCRMPHLRCWRCCESGVRRSS